MTRRTGLALAGAAAALVAAAAVLSWLAGLGGGAGVPVHEVRRERFARRISAEGNLEAVKATPLTTPLEAQGPLKIAWIAPDGSRVRAGEVVVRFDPTDKEKEVADGKADRAVAENKISKRRLEDEAALRNLARDTEQYRLELDKAVRFSSKDPEIFSRVEIIESQIDEKLAGHRVEHAEQNRLTRESLSKADVDLLAIERHKADLKVREGEKVLRSLEMISPHDGILTLKRDWRGNPPRVGETVWSGEAIAEIPDLEAMEAEVYVLEADAGGLAAGLPATVEVEARPGEIHPAKVKRVDTLARPRFRGVPVQYFSVTLEFERTVPEAMKPGQRVRADLVVAERQDALVVPREAVVEKDGKSVVYRRDGLGFEAVEVVLGPTALGRVVIESGLEEGDVIALRDPTATASDAAAPVEPSAPAAASPAVAGGMR